MRASTQALLHTVNPRGQVQSSKEIHCGHMERPSGLKPHGSPTPGPAATPWEHPTRHPTLSLCAGGARESARATCAGSMGGEGERRKGKTTRPAQRSVYNLETATCPVRCLPRCPSSTGRPAAGLKLREGNIQDSFFVFFLDLFRANNTCSLPCNFTEWRRLETPKCGTH